MSLATVVDTLAAQLRAELGAGTTVGDVLPTAAGDMPAVTLSVQSTDEELVGIGRIPRGTRRGALEVSTSIDLADPVLRAGGEELLLLSIDRQELILPHGQLVRADGTEDPPFDTDDLDVADGDGAYTVVADDPAGRQVRPDPTRGVLTFGQPLPPAGTLLVTYHVGQWDVTTVRFSGDLTVEVTAEDATLVADLTRQTAAALDRPTPAFPRLTPVGWSAARPTVPEPDSARSQILAYRFDFEIEEPSLPSGGGVIRTVAVTVRRDGTTEQFDVTSEGGTP
jgi:hypothetical protein